MALLFPPWRIEEWTPQNDSLRGGSSTSNLTLSPSGKSAIFSGTLDSKTLGGAGFASVYISGAWDWRGKRGLMLKLRVPEKAIEKKFTLTLKNDVPTEGSVERSTVTFEFHFVPGVGETVFAPFEDFRATYRGRPAEGEGGLMLGEVRRVGFMVRSFFGKGGQEGEFEVGVQEVRVVGKDEEEEEKRGRGRCCIM